MAAAALKRQRATAAVYLGGVEKPYNLGAILHSCAHFGIRVAEGGTEHVMLVHLHQPLQQLGRRQSGFEFLVTAAGEGTSHYLHAFRERCVLILGNESEGINPALYKAPISCCTSPAAVRSKVLISRWPAASSPRNTIAGTMPAPRRAANDQRRRTDAAGSIIPAVPQLRQRTPIPPPLRRCPAAPSPSFVPKYSPRNRHPLHRNSNRPRRRRHR